MDNHMSTPDYRVLTELISDFTFSVSFEGNTHVLDWISGNFTKVTGYLPDELPDLTSWSVLVDQSTLQRLPFIIERLASGLEIREDVSISTKMGENKHVRVFAHPLWDEQHTQIRRVFGAVQDVTHFIKVEQALAEQLQESQALFEISQLLSQSYELPIILNQILNAVVSLIKQADQAVIHMIDDNGILVPVAVAKNTGVPLGSMNLRIGQGIAGRVLQDRKTINIADVETDPRFLRSDDFSPDYRSMIVVPLSSGQNCTGTISVLSSLINSFDPVAERVLTTLGTQAAIALEKTRLLEDEQERRLLAETLREISVSYIHIATPEKTLNRLLEQIRKILPYDRASVILVEDEKARIAQSYLAQDDQLVQDTDFLNTSINLDGWSYYQTMVENETAIVVPDVSVISVWDKDICSSGSWAGVPINAQGKLIGFFSLEQHTPGSYKSRNIEKLNLFSSQASLTLQNVMLNETTQSRLREVNLLYQINRTITESSDLDIMLKQLVDLLQQHFNFYHVQIFLLDANAKWLLYREGSGTIGTSLKRKTQKIRIGQGVPGHVALTAHPFVSNNVQDTPFNINNPLLPDVHAELAVPLRSGEKLLGVLDILHCPPSIFSDHDLQLMTTVADQLTVAIEKELLYTDLQTTLLQEQAARAQMVQSEKLAALGRIVASVAHELNNPLQAIQNALYLIDIEEAIPQQVHEDIQVALTEANRMAGLITRLREIYRPTASEEFQLSSLNILVDDVQKLLSTHLRRSNIAFEFKPQENLPGVKIIQDQMKQVFLNICLNAVESMPKGGNLRVSSRMSPDFRNVILDFEDTGPGIPSEVLPYIFDPFVTTKEGGTGLGLAITYDIIRRHGGQIDVETKQGGGTTFRVLLPVDGNEEIISQEEGTG
jgi:PAS domain S-box-containing protein